MSKEVSDSGRRGPDPERERERERERAENESESESESGTLLEICVFKVDRGQRDSSHWKAKFPYAYTHTHAHHRHTQAHRYVHMSARVLRLACERSDTTYQAMCTSYLSHRRRRLSGAHKCVGLFTHNMNTPHQSARNPTRQIRTMLIAEPPPPTHDMSALQVNNQHGPVRFKAQCAPPYPDARTRAATGYHLLAPSSVYRT